MGNSLQGQGVLHEPKQKRLDSQAKAARMGKAFEMRHAWFTPLFGDGWAQWVCCAVCGVVRRADGKNENTCKGPVRIVLRKQGMIHRAKATAQI